MKPIEGGDANCNIQPAAYATIAVVGQDSNDAAEARASFRRRIRKIVRDNLIKEGIEVIR